MRPQGQVGLSNAPIMEPLTPNNARQLATDLHCDGWNLKKVPAGNKFAASYSLGRGSVQIRPPNHASSLALAYITERFMPCDMIVRYCSSTFLDVVRVDVDYSLEHCFPVSFPPAIAIGSSLMSLISTSTSPLHNYPKCAVSSNSTMRYLK